jgi:S-DNA-T family DNA segregation ATPase FtsK/SpoIIIE
MFYVAVPKSRHLVVTRVVAIVFAIVSMAGLLAMFDWIKPNDTFPQAWGGRVGHMIYQQLLADALGPFGSGLLLGTVYTFALLFIITKDIASEIEKILTNFGDWRAQRAKRKAELEEERQKAKDARERARNHAAPLPTAAPAAVVGPAGAKKIVLAKAEEPLARPAAKPATPIPAPVARIEPKAPPAKEPAPRIALTIVKPEEPKKAAKVTLPQSTDTAHIFPPLSLLKEQVKPSSSNSDEEHSANATSLMRILGEFGVEVSLGEIHVGPVITRYEVVPAPGVRVEKIAGLDKNIALGMRAQSVRILAPIPGKAAVGVEVPNQHPTPVGMRELLESEDWANAKAELPIALGKDVSGRPLISDLAKMPHLLIAGATGSGKSVCINSIVASILYSKSPTDVRLIMVDPKVVELKIFNSLTHMYIPVVTEPKKVPAALKWLLGEMEQRYQIFAKSNVRNIVGFNNRKKGPKEAPPAQASLDGLEIPRDDDLPIPDRLPYIVAIIDELADLMMVAPAEIETSIARLAQLARAAGIHLIIATQRPSVNVITGVIKANLPSRIAFQVASQVDSRTILDTKGAETLIGRGDMLFSPPGTSRLVRAQGCFVADEEVQAIVEFMKKNGEPQYAKAVQQQIDKDSSEDDEEEGDEVDGESSDEELYAKAIDVLKSSRRASTSMLQRRLRIGYNRAARIMEMMEEKGVVGPENGSSPREILGDLDG